jgi:phosphate:Na+ symporter
MVPGSERRCEVDVKDIMSKVVVMADTLKEMLELVEKGFMEHKQEYLNSAMVRERSINEMEKSLTGRVLELSRAAKNDADRRNLVAMEQAVETLERMGDEAASLVERIEMKNAEHLLFSDLGVAQYNETYATMMKSIEMMCAFLSGKDGDIKGRVVDNGFRVKSLVERYRAEHMERLVKGVCTPMAANMFFDMLDFTGNIARHSSNVVKLF